MNDSQANEVVDLGKSIDAAARVAEAQEAAAASMPDASTYTHTFNKPFSWRGSEYTEMTFDWESLTGKDSLAIENELRNKGVTLVIPAYTGEYLAGMAARACTVRDDKGQRLIGQDAINAMPLSEFQRIIGRARTLLLRSGA